ncbi:MAG: PaeR7I family type II restriction endonuclease, partial [Streptosporangiaceae bacterium]
SGCQILPRCQRTCARDFARRSAAGMLTRPPVPRSRPTRSLTSPGSIGNAEDIWTAYREGRFGRCPAPMIGYFFLLEDCARVHAPVGNVEPYFTIDPVFTGSSYAKRYEILCERLVLERKYTSACLALATKSNPTRVTFPGASLSFRQFAAAADAHARAFVNTR